MKKYFRIILACVTVTAALVGTVHAAETATSHPIELLWPNGAPGAKGSQEGDKPTLTICLPDKETATGTAVVICPGGNAHLPERFARLSHREKIRYRLNLARTLCRLDESTRTAGSVVRYRCDRTSPGHKSDSGSVLIDISILTLLSGSR